MQNKIELVYDRMSNEVRTMIILTSPKRRLLDFESAAINAFRAAFPKATVNGLLFSFDTKRSAKN